MGDPTNAETRAELKALLADKERLKRLVAIATKLARGSEAPFDLINAACVKLLSGATPWRREVHDDLVAHLGSVMSANASNTKTSADNRRQRKFHTPEEQDGVRDDRAGADEQLLDDEAERRAEQKLGRWLIALRKDRANDPESLTLLDCFERELLTAAQQVAETGWRVEDVRRVRKRLFENAERVMHENPDDSGQYVPRGAEL